MTRLLLIVCGLGLLISLLVRGATSLASVEPVGGTASAPDLVSQVGRPPAIASHGETLIARDSSGQFRLDLTINGQQLPFLVDTGADAVTLTIDSARAVGLHVDPQSFTEVAMGAGGPVKGARIVIDRIEIGGRSLTGVEGLVLEGLETNLLGQSALSQLGGVDLRGDQMVLR